MKAFRALLLFVAYVSVDSHYCDPLAADTYKKPGADPDKGDQHIPLGAFLRLPRARYFVSHATLSKLPKANSFCSATSHGEECGAIEFFREITDGPDDPTSEKGANKLKFNTVFVGVKEEETEAVEYTVLMNGIDEDDYIIQADPNVAIQAVRIHKDGRRVDIEEENIPPEIIESLRKPYGLFHSEEHSFTVYCTCDGTTIWVSYSRKYIEKGKLLEKDPALDIVLENLKARAWEIRKEAGIEKEEPEIRGIPTIIKNENFYKMIPVP
ncbi:uncharacterized protein LOC135842064 [Planococcus citri]|uniref:uncharacterized protein LOC135842064 n=1 Tax=Planococcus citri TaxID=170843 RepID=UPI0031F9F8EE